MKSTVYVVLKYKCPHPDTAHFPTVKYYTVVAAGLDKKAMQTLMLFLEPGLKLLAKEDADLVYFTDSNNVVNDNDTRWVKP